MKNKKTSIFKLFLIIIILIGGAFSSCKIFSSYNFFDFLKKKSLFFNLNKIVDIPEEGIEKWIKFNPKEENFSVRFPKKPEYLKTEFPIPRSDDILPYHEYKCCENEMIISVSYTVLPEEWLKWGSKLVLKGAINVIVAQLKEAHLVGQSSNIFKSYSALDFEYYLGEQESSGTLILVKNVLYKVEITYPVSEKKEAHNKLAHFLKSFEPSKS